MSMEYPYVYFEKDGKCRKFSDDTVISYCVMGPCLEQKLSNGDRIRAMSDEKLAEWLCQSLDCDFCKAYLQNMSIYSCCENQVKGIFDWLQSPAEEDT